MKIIGVKRRWAASAAATSARISFRVFSFIIAARNASTSTPTSRAKRRSSSSLNSPRRSNSQSCMRQKASAPPSWPAASAANAARQAFGCRLAGLPALIAPRPLRWQQRPTDARRQPIAAKLRRTFPQTRRRSINGGQQAADGQPTSRATPSQRQMRCSAHGRSGNSRKHSPRSASPR